MHLISRRTALAATGAAAAYFNVRTAGAAAASASDVLVVGGGISGLYAAMLAQDQGFKVRVLEAKPKVGGRLTSFRHIDGTPEAGGDSILGGYGRVRDMCGRLGLSLFDFEGRRSKGGSEIALGGHVIPKKDWPTHPLNKMPAPARDLFPGRRYFEKVVDDHNPLASAEDWTDPASQKFDESVHDFLTRVGWSPEAIKQNYEINIGRGTSAHDCSILTWYFRRAWDKIQSDIESVAFKVKGGNQSLPEAMAAGLGDVVLVDHAVAGIRTDANGIEVLCTNGSRHTAKYLIVATPLPPLRHVRFDPLLPPAVAKAIATVPSMQITKVFLQAKRPFWENDGLSPAMWTDTTAGEIAALRHDEASDRITSLVARVRGFTSARLDALGEQEAGRQIVADYEQLRPAAKGQLEVVGYKSWARDVYAGGTWTEWNVGQIHAFLPELIKPAGRIHFAGEHASLANRGMEAAMEAGERAALEVMARL